MAEVITVRKEIPPTPVRELSWMSGILPCRAMPRAFHPKPVKTVPRSCSKATHAAAATAAAARLRHELSQTDRKLCGFSRGVAATQTMPAQTAG